MDFVVIYGPPGVGKLTTAKELSRLTGYKLFDNHASIDVIRRVFDFGDEPFWPMVHRLRFDVIEEAAKRDVSVVFTLAYDHPNDIKYAERVFSVVETHSGQVLLVRLTCEMPVLEQRIQSESRSNKMNSLEIARADMAKRDYFSPISGRDSLSIDNTDLAPEDSARRIIAHYGLEVIPS